MRAPLLFVIVAGACLGCSIDPDTGTRFRAERALYQANWEYQKIAVRPQDVTEDMWRSLAARFEAVADHQRASSDTVGADHESQIVAARGLFIAAQIYTSIQDTTRSDEIFLRMQEDYAGISDVSAPVSMAQGSVAERRGHFPEAIAHYEAVVRQIEPAGNDPGVAGGVLELPFRIARMRSIDAEPAIIEASYDTARAYYEDLIAEESDPRLVSRARLFLTDIAADLGDWDEATHQLTTAEEELRSATEPHQDPAELRYQLALLKQRAGGDVQEIESLLRSLVEEYPDSPVVPTTLLTLAQAAAGQGRTDEAIRHLDAIRSDHAENEGAATNALLMRARLLEKDDARWSEALDTYRELTLSHPISDAALLAPLEIVQHYDRVNDEEAKRDALQRAAREYEDFIARYPPGPHTLMARERLARTLAMQQDFAGAIAQMERVGESAAGSPQGAMALVSAAGIAYNELADTTRALAILDRVSDVYAQADIGSWAKTEALRIRGGEPAMSEVP